MLSCSPHTAAVHMFSDISHCLTSGIEDPRMPLAEPRSPPQVIREAGRDQHRNGCVAGVLVGGDMQEGLRRKVPS